MNILITPKKITSHKKLKSIIHKEEEYIKLREQRIHFFSKDFVNCNQLLHKQTIEVNVFINKQKNTKDI